MITAKKLRSRNYAGKNITSRIKRGVFHNLTKEQMRTIIVLLSRVMEDSYRRGFQQAIVNYHHINPYTKTLAETGDLRYGYIRDVSPEHIAEYHKKSDVYGYSAIGRLKIEYENDLETILDFSSIKKDKVKPENN